MGREEDFRTGIVAFAILTCASVIGIAGSLLITSAQDFNSAYESWNCLVSRESDPPQPYLYCLPGALRFWVIAFLATGGSLGALCANRMIMVDPAFDEMIGKIFVRFALAAAIAGSLLFLQFYLVSYVFAFRSPWYMAIWAASTMTAGRFVFPRTNPAILLPPLAIAGFFKMVLISMVLGIVFN